jgi:hypothetical protein
MTIFTLNEKKIIRTVIFFIVFLLFQTTTKAQVFTESNLPIVIINSDNAQEIPDEPSIFGDMKVIYKGEGIQNYVSDQFNPLFLNYNGRIEIQIRGSSSQILPKKQYAFSTKLADNVTNNNVVLLGMPSENDWILNGLAFDSSLIRDYLSYNISRNMGNYATRTQYCEVVINGQYMGLYLLQEKIKADSNRVNVLKITTAQNTLPLLSGGYITKCDKTTGGDPVAWQFSTNIVGDFTDFIHELPKPYEVTTAQDLYIHNIFIKLANTTSADNTAVLNGYPSVIDIPSFIDFMLSNELASNADGYELSTFFHKDRNAKLRAGPIWDFNLTYGNDLFFWGYDRSHPNVWQFNNGDNVGAKFWKDLFDNPLFKCYLSKRWHEITQVNQPMHLLTLNTFIDNTVNYISQAQIRDYQKWGTIVDFSAEIAFIKTFLNARTIWMNANIGSYVSCSNVTVPELVITKISYNPSTNAVFPISNDQEFIAIKNTGTQGASLNGIYFRGTGFVYQFPFNQTIAANATIYLASKATTFLSKYGFLPFGEFTRNLSNNNQDLVLADAFGNNIDKVHYYDSAPWPNADGNGSFLQLIDTALDNNLGSSWIASSSTLATATFSEGDFFSISPNPAANFIRFNANISIDSIEIFDVNGRKIQFIVANLSDVEIDISAFKSGVYFVKVFCEGKSFTKKFIKLG